MTPMITASH